MAPMAHDLIPRGDLLVQDTVDEPIGLPLVAPEADLSRLGGVDPVGNPIFL